MLMEFPFNVYGLAFSGAWACTWLTLPLWRAWANHIGLVDDPGHRKIHAAPVPLAGGLAVYAGMVLPLLWGVIALQADFGFAREATVLSHGFSRRAMQLGALMIGALGMVILGWLDDKYELAPALKFAGQCGVALLVSATGVRITLFVPNLLFSYAITVLWILTVTNAFNFMDNMNGLCAGLGAIAAFFFGLSAAIHGQYLVTLIALLMCGALLGFLPYNFPRASVFLGDAGSHLVGYMMAVLAILPHFYSQSNPRPWGVLSPLIVLGVPLADLAWVVVLRWRLGKPFYVGDNNHWSHRLVRRGWSRAGAVLIIWLVAILCGGLALAIQGQGR
jgi:UDP-GlcNAc:undecaprenyl-phosphate GlcNAc-1-phosphate transferase